VLNLLTLPFDKVPYLSKTDVDYQLNRPALKDYYGFKPELSNIQHQIDYRKQFHTDRELLVEVLESQYESYDPDTLETSSIKSLLDSNVFTMTTAHQPCLMTGPLYTIIKAIGVINGAKAASQASGASIVPVFVVGGEDHDFEEVNHFQLFNDTVSWEHDNTGGPVGRLQTDTLSKVLDIINERLGKSERDEYIKELIRSTHYPGRPYATAFAHFLQKLLGKYGLIVLRMDEPLLKKAFAPHMKREIEEQMSYNEVRPTQISIEDAGYKPQAYVRKLNLFLIKNGIRERILPVEDTQDAFVIESTNTTIKRQELLDLCEKNPAQFSPNVVMRPLFQELILPNLAYIGGGGELAYWLERKGQFKSFGIPYPMLIRRDSILWIQKRDWSFLKEHDIDMELIFKPADEWIRHYVEQTANNSVSLEREKQEIAGNFHEIIKKAEALDPTLAKSFEAEKLRQLKAIDSMESRLFRTVKHQHDQTTEKLARIKDRLFPNHGLLERKDNFISYYLKYGDEFFDVLLDKLDPFDPNFKVLVED
jgi:bacillithiol synthase